MRPETGLFVIDFRARQEAVRRLPANYGHRPIRQECRRVKLAPHIELAGIRPGLRLWII